MKCEKCGEKLEVVRRCSQVRLKCCGCKKEFQVHEVAALLDDEIEEKLSNYTALIYD